MSRTGFTLVRAIFAWYLCYWSLPIAAQEREGGCEAETEVDKAVESMQIGQEPERVYKTLTNALSCRGGDSNQDAYYFLAVTELRLALIEEARQHVRLAEECAAAAKDRSMRKNAEALEELLQQEIAPITFALPDEAHDMVSVRLDWVDEGSLPDPVSLRRLFSPQMAKYLKDPYHDTIHQARKKLEEGRESPITVWLPRGRYRLSSGQTFLVVGQPNTITLTDLKWPKHTTMVTAALMGMQPLDPKNITSGDSARGGVNVSYGLRVLNNTLITFDFGGYGIGIPLSAANQASDSAGSTFESQGIESTSRTLTAGVGVVQALKVSGSLYSFLGASLRGAGMQGLLVMDTSSYPFYDVSWYGIGPYVDLKLYYAVARTKQYSGGIVLGATGGMSVGGFSSLPKPKAGDFAPGVTVPENYTFASNLEERTWASYGVQLGGTILF